MFSGGRDSASFTVPESERLPKREHECQVPELNSSCSTNQNTESHLPHPPCFIFRHHSASTTPSVSLSATATHSLSSSATASPSSNSRSCEAIKSENPEAVSGVYVVTLGAYGQTHTVYCDMEVDDSAGYTLLWKNVGGHILTTQSLKCVSLLFILIFIFCWKCEKLKLID
jgi:hypothetical protein